MEETSRLMREIDYRVLIRDVRFWIFIFFVLRLYGIFNPPLEVGHNWRQSDVMMVARNFLEVDNNIFYPRVDVAGNKTGITGMEFPVFNYLIYLTSLIFGYEHWYGRLINLIVSSLGLSYFFKLVKNLFSEKIALYSTIILAISIWFQFSRKIMPDTFSMSLLFAGMYYGVVYLQLANKTLHKLLTGSFILIALAILSKISSGYLIPLFLVFIFCQDSSINKKISIFSLTILSGSIASLWYFYWVPHINVKYGFEYFFMGDTFTNGFLELYNNIPEVLFRFYDTALKYIGFLVFLLGLYFVMKNKNKKLIFIFLLSSLCFMILMIKEGTNFYHHNYYVIPFVPIMALIAGYGLSLIQKQRIAIVFLIAICVENFANQFHDFSINDKAKFLINMEDNLDRFSSKKDLILINGNGYPTPMYFANRRGWIVNDYEISEDYISELSKRGLKYIVIFKTIYGKNVNLISHKRIFESLEYDVYRIKNQ